VQRCAMPLPLAVMAMVLILAGFVLYGMLSVRLYKRLWTALQRQGYRSPAVLNGAGAAAFALPFVCMLLLMQLLENDDHALLWFLLLFLAAPLALTLAVRFLPSRNPRVAGRRVLRFPYRHVGYVLLAAAAAQLAAAEQTSKSVLARLGVLC